jgi:uroporphyrinogen decarboxylase
MTDNGLNRRVPGGRNVFAPIHVIQAGVPPENIIAWWETLMEYGRYDET